MTKAERAEVRALIAEAPKALAPIFESFMRAITALDEKDALIVELIDLAYNGFGDIDSGSSRRQHQMALAALKARAEK